MLKYFPLLCVFILVACSDQDQSARITPATKPDSTDMSTPSLTFLALGDSYTIGEAVEEDDRWPVQLADSLNALNIPYDDPVIIARTGWRTDELIQAIVTEEPENTYDMVSLLIGVNNQYQHKPVSVYRTEFRQLLETAISLAGGDSKRVMVLSIPDYGFTPFGKANQETISAELDAYNTINREITEEAGVLYIYITDISRNGLDNSVLVASDGLHPSGEQYSLWVKRILDDPLFRERFITN